MPCGASLNRRGRRLPGVRQRAMGSTPEVRGTSCVTFRIDVRNVGYLEFTGRPPDQVAMVEADAKKRVPPIIQPLSVCTPRESCWTSRSV
jgi:hypothetical protein